jgi:hypothetical protein
MENNSCHLEFSCDSSCVLGKCCTREEAFIMRQLFPETVIRRNKMHFILKTFSRWMSELHVKYLRGKAKETQNKI